MKISAFLAILVLSSFICQGQENFCGTDEAHKALLNSDSNYAANLHNQRLQWSKHINLAERNLDESEADLYEIPVVIHVLHTGQNLGTPQNPSFNTLELLIAELNGKFAAAWPGVAGVNTGGVAIPIRFKLAQRTPDCQPTDGINRIDASWVPDYANGIAYGSEGGAANEIDLKTLSRWPNTDYLNIWIVMHIQGGWAGYAYYPGAPPSVDGIVLHYNHTSWSLAHEVGHYLGLRHTFEGSTSASECPINANCSLDGDMVCDTDPHSLMNGCVQGINTCTGGSLTPVIHNHMNYTSCRNRFSAGQKDRLVFMLQSFRSSLITSNGAVPVGSDPVVEAPAPTCVPPELVFPNTYNMGVHSVSLADMNYFSSGYNGDDLKYYIDHTNVICGLQPQPIANLIAGNSYSITVTTGYNSENVRGWIDFNGNGVFHDGELIISTNGSLPYESHTANFTVPLSASTNGSLRMRISSDYNFSAAPTACSGLDYGQTEDFIVFVTNSLEVNTPSITSVVLYPNPVEDIINFSEPLDYIEIYALDGKNAYKGRQNKHIDISMFESGVYILTAITADGIPIRKLLVKN